MGVVGVERESIDIGYICTIDLKQPKLAGRFQRIDGL